eukprot:CAMPEP_0119008956 /NCGR_PEP_ID=MMETSP1176-20130426/4047_1 /TAXON_ID=265551 /ORGANISM="Synedropsis recta cf, Strain CCMP1620" /LENGTH=211 /DNA_ID=CAMNT_0006961377 /DNA_START=215 /DNA_END=850 /DNA_ORIENTATION=+
MKISDALTTLAWFSDRTPVVVQRGHHGAILHAVMFTNHFSRHHLIISLPGRNVIHHSNADVLGGRGKHLDSHPGNVRFSQLADMFKTAYRLGSRNRKREIINDIRGIMERQGCRFLKLEKYQADADIWQWAEDPKPSAKIGQKLRDMYNSTFSPRHHPVGGGFLEAPVVMPRFLEPSLDPEAATDVPSVEDIDDAEFLQSFSDIFSSELKT